MSTPKMISAMARSPAIDRPGNSKVIDQFSLEDVDVINLDASVLEDKPVALRPMHPRPMLPSRVAIIGNYLPRQCGIATFTTDLCDAIHAEYSATELLALPVNETPEGYIYPARIRFELAQDELASYRHASTFLNFRTLPPLLPHHQPHTFAS